MLFLCEESLGHVIEKSWKACLLKSVLILDNERKNRLMARRFIYWQPLIIVLLIIAAIVMLSVLLIMAHTAFTTAHQVLVGSGKILPDSFWHD
jgi:hypothetical protein